MAFRQFAIFAKNPLFNIPLITGILGRVLLIEAFAMLCAMCVSLCYGELDWISLLISALIVAAVGGATWFVPIKRHSLSAHDGVLITTSAWVLITLCGALPFLFSPNPSALVDALFESMSGFTTTGASVMTDVESLGHGINMWRALTQWIGGIGIILFTLTLVPALNKSGGARMMAAETSDFSFDKTSPRIMQTARNLALVYLILTLLCILLLWAGPMGLYDSVAHTFATISTGGFSPYSDGLERYHSVYVKIVTTVFMFLGGVNFTLLVFAFKGNFRSLFGNSTLRIFIVTILAVSALFAVSMILEGFGFSFEEMVVNPIFMVVSAISSTGFTVGHYETWGPLVFLLVLMLMYSGACAGSTTGGAKIDRVIVFFRNCGHEISGLVNHTTIYSVKDGDKLLSEKALLRINSFLVLYMVTLLFGILTLIFCGLSVDDSTFAVFSCTCNNGLGYGLTGAEGGFWMLPTSAKWVLIPLMYIGRLEISTVFILALPSFWNR